MIIKYKKLLGEGYSLHEIEIDDETILKLLNIKNSCISRHDDYRRAEQVACPECGRRL